MSAIDRRNLPDSVQFLVTSSGFILNITILLDKKSLTFVRFDVALDGNVLDRCIPFSDLKHRLNNYITELWKNEWDR